MLNNSSSKVSVVGSFAVGLTLRADRFPVRGETLIGRDFDQGPGGKGSNQAVQIARLGMNVEMIGLIGVDAFGDMALSLYEIENVGTSFFQRMRERNTGVGFIVLDRTGDNFIILDPGANALLSPAHLDRAAMHLEESDVVITQLEIQLETAGHAMELARHAGVITILNPAPARLMPREILANVDVLTPNETELRILLGRAPDDPSESLDLCNELLQADVGTVVLTRGERGALVVTANGYREIPAFEVKVVDTTGAGDAFNGTLAASLAEGLPLERAARRASAAGALACTRLGVIPSLPRAADLDNFLNGK